MKKIYLTLLAVAAFTYSSNAQNIFPTPSGNVGIGTATPQNVLHVNGGITSTNGGPISTATPSANLFYDAVNDKSVLYSFQPSVAWKPFLFGASSFSFVSYGTNQGLFQDSFGNVGIGTTSPASLLHIRGASPASGTFLTIDDQATTGRTGVRLLFASLGVAHWNIGIPADVDAFTINGWQGNSNPEYFRINSTGNVGIGTTDTKGYKLAVNGNVIATAVTVKLYSEWPDYVFRPTYNLKSLSEVKTYIDQNHHLPEMPSEKEVAEKGLDLGEMNKILAKKVEELTLYLIEKDKEVKEINQKQQAESENNQKLQEQLKVMQAQLNQIITQKTK